MYRVNEINLKDNLDDKSELVGLYICSDAKTEDNRKLDIYLQLETLENYCDETKQLNRIIYIDEVCNESQSKRKLSFQKLLNDIDHSRIKKVIVTSPNVLFKKYEDLINFCCYAKFRKVELMSVIEGKIDTSLFITVSKEITNKYGLLHSDIQFKQNNKAL